MHQYRFEEMNENLSPIVHFLFTKKVNILYIQFEEIMFFHMKVILFRYIFCIYKTRISVNNTELRFVNTSLSSRSISSEYTQGSSQIAHWQRDLVIQVLRSLGKKIPSRME